ncbi:MAG: hypothetical protein ACRDUA_21560, partial [Micromonosporaceae bacterium]
MKAAATSLAAAVALAGLAGCGEREQAAPSDPPMQLTAEQEALTELGFPPEAVVPKYDPGDPKRDRDRHKGRFGNRHLAKRVLHGEFVVSTKDGPRTIVVQRGEITAIDDDSMTVKSSDGFSLTWTYGKKLRVLERRRTVDGDALKVGERVGVAGGDAKSGAVARL